MRIAQKGLLLVAVPLLFELAFVGALVYLLRQAEDQTIKLMQARNVIVRTDALARKMQNATLAMAGYAVTNDRNTLTACQAILDQLPSDFAKVEEAARGNQQEIDVLKQVANQIEHYGSLLKEIRVAIETRDHLDVSEELFKQVRESSVEVNNMVQSISKADKALEKDLLIQQVRTRNTVVSILAAGVMANIFIAVWLAYFYSRNFVDRLRILKTNSELFGKRQDFLPEVGGNDEISEVDHTFREMAETVKQLEQRKREFVSMISHDLRSPLMSIEMTLALFNEGLLGQVNSNGQKRLTAARNNIGRLMNLIRELIDVEAMETGNLNLELTSSCIDDIFQYSFQSIQSLAENKNIAIEFKESNLYVNADADRIVQVVTNLCSNAIKFSPDGSKITLLAKDEGEWARISVQDQGRGIPEALQANIFDRFKQVEKADRTEKQGSGLGLAICKSIVEAHGGTIGLISKENEGTEFWFTLPSSEPAF